MPSLVSNHIAVAPMSRHRNNQKQAQMVDRTLSTIDILESIRKGMTTRSLEGTIGNLSAEVDAI
jgi:hypothetical protein